MRWDVAAKLLSYGASPRCVLSTTHDTPLHLALRANNVELVATLIKKGSDWEMKNFRGVTPRMLAEDSHDPQVQILLTQAG
mmetsp:Transcript_66142/g.156225  ORF Transcript_66142/g.156225 Transcript_66142/m.156225 type:complete len:81 (+) Transcript_66142:317-559(+)